MCFLRLGREKAAELLIQSGADVNQANNKVGVLNFHPKIVT